jgi:hypothetical protein
MQRKEAAGAGAGAGAGASASASASAGVRAGARADAGAGVGAVQCECGNESVDPCPLPGVDDVCSTFTCCSKVWWQRHKAPPCEHPKKIAASIRREAAVLMGLAAKIQGRYASVKIVCES